MPPAALYGVDQMLDNMISTPRGHSTLEIQGIIQQVAAVMMFPDPFSWDRMDFTPYLGWRKLKGHQKCACQIKEACQRSGMSRFIQ